MISEGFMTVQTVLFIYVNGGSYSFTILEAKSGVGWELVLTKD